jgi:hypothetical protein
MHFLTDAECREWLQQEDIDAVDSRGFPEVVGDYEVFFAAPKEARAQQMLAREMVEWVGEFDAALLWLSDWPAYRPEEMAIALALRRAHGEERHLIDAPGHLFTWQEKDELVGWIALLICFGWDGFLFASPFKGSMFQTSHEDFLWATAASAECFAVAKQFPRRHGLEIYRETQARNS